MPDMNTSFRSGSQRGAATLIVVMVLFFVMSLVAAYTSRNLIFEQKTSANLFLATSLAETADAGLDWTLGMLNSGRVGDDCRPSTDPLAPSFRERYLDLDGDSGAITVKPGVRDGPLWPTCWFDRSANTWNCHCPSDPGAPGSIATPTGNAIPAFRVRFVNLGNAVTPAQPGIVRVEVQACAQFDASCLSFPAADTSECRGSACAMIALSPAVKTRPVEALRARGNVVAPLRVSAGDGTHAVRSGGAVDPAVIAQGPAGTPGSSSDSSVPVLNPASLSEERMFAAVFGAWPLTYISQPAAVAIPCSSACGSTVIRDAIALNPGRVFIVNGDLSLDGGAPLGTEMDPVTLVVNGNLRFSAPTTIHGLVYARTSDWVTSGDGTVIGAVVAEGNVTGSGTFRVVHNREVLNRLHYSSGSMVLIPGGWKDFP